MDWLFGVVDIPESVLLRGAAVVVLLEILGVGVSDRLEVISGALVVVAVGLVVVDRFLVVEVVGGLVVVVDGGFLVVDVIGGDFVVVVAGGSLVVVVDVVGGCVAALDPRVTMEYARG